MKLLTTTALLLFCAALFGQPVTENYPADPASAEQAGIPKGEVLKFTFDKSAIFAGTWREYWVYIPAQYQPGSPACVYVNQDGLQWNAPVVFDNLINSKEMPVTIGVFVNPGIVKAGNPSEALNRFNRSFEYDGLGDAYARFILEEILPEVEKHTASDGRPIRLSKNGNDRCIGGASSGAVCAFTAAWEKPAEFSRVFSAIGTYVGLRGADRYPTLVRKYAPKPIRVFLQDGSNDLNIYAGDWWKANETMERALSFAGYEVQHAWGEGQHNGKHGSAIFPQAMRWLWKGWPQPVTTGASKNQVLADILIPGEDWKLVGSGYSFTEGTATDAAGNVYYQDIPTSKTYFVNTEGKLVTLPLYAKKASGTAIGPDGKRYTVAGETKQVLMYDEKGNETVVADSVAGNDIVVANNGNMYITSPNGTDKPSKLYLLKPGGKPQVVDQGLRFANGCALSPDQTQLYVTESATHWVWVYRILDDGTLGAKQRFGWLHVADSDDNAWSDGLRCDTAGRVYVTTRLGIQVMDQLGRVNAIIPIPQAGASNLCFGGKDFDTMYVTAVDKVYARKLKTRGCNPFQKSVLPAPPKL